jgi:hypothetical protein
MKKLMPILGVLLVFVVIWAGFSQSDQWLVLPLGGLFTAAYISGKWALWKDLFNRPEGGAASQKLKLFQSLLATYVVETLLVFALYWLGRGVSDLL